MFQNYYFLQFETSKIYVAPKRGGGVGDLRKYFHDIYCQLKISHIMENF
jgi:hypothetical protein